MKDQMTDPTARRRHQPQDTPISTHYGSVETLVNEARADLDRLTRLGKGLRDLRDSLAYAAPADLVPLKHGEVEIEVVAEEVMRAKRAEVSAAFQGLSATLLRLGRVVLELDNAAALDGPAEPPKQIAGPRA